MDPTTAKIQDERLLTAVRNRYINRIETLLNQGCSPNNSDPDCQHPLDLAIETNNLQAVSLLIARGAYTDRPIEQSKKQIALHRAVIRGNKDIISEVLQHTAEWNAVDVDGASVLHLASEADKEDEIIEIMKIFLDLGMDVDAKTTPRGETPLLIAGKRRLEKIVEFLIERGADVNARDCDGNSLIHHLLKDTNCPEYFVKRLLSRGADANRTNDAGESPLRLARSANAIEFLLDHVEDLPNFRDERGRTILHVVLELNVNSDDDQVEKMVDFLLGKGLSVDATDGDGNTALHTAVKQKKWFVVAKLLERLGEVNARNHLGQTALHAMISHYNPCQTGYRDAVGALMAKGADIEIQDNDGLNALQLAAKYKHKWILEMFKEKGADFGILTAKGESLLHLFVGDDYNDRITNSGMLKLLIDEGCDVNATTADGLSPLHLALKARNVDAVKSLMELHGADVTAEAADGKSTVHLATESCEYDVLRALVRAGAYCDHFDDYGYTPLYYAAKIESYHLRKMMVYLLEAGADIDGVRFDDSERSCLKECRDVRLYLNKSAHINFAIPRVFGITVAELLANRDYSYGIDEQFHEDCRSEVEKMKGLYVDEDVSLYDFLHANLRRRIQWVNREKLVDAVKFPKLKDDFPLYCDIIFGRYSQTLMVESAQRAFRLIDRFALPDICVERVFSYLDNRSLSALSRVDNMNARKRTRRSSTCSASKKRRIE